MAKKIIVSASNKRALKLKVLAKKKERVRRRLVVTAGHLRLKAKQLAVTAKGKESIRYKLSVTAEQLRLKAKQLAVTARERETIRRKLEVTAKTLAVTAKERESVRRKLAVTAEQLRLKAKQLAVTAKERESVRRKLEVTAKKLAVTAKERESVRRKLEVTAEKLAVIAKERESIRRRLEVTAETLAVTAKERESVRRKLAVTAKERESVRRKLEVTAEKLAVTAKERESIRRKLEVTAEKLAVTAKERESVRRKLEVTAEKLAVTAKERESVRRKLAVTAEQLRLKAKQLATTAKERETVRRKLEVTAENLSLQAKQLAVIAKERESIRRRLEVTAETLAVTARERESVRRRLVVTAKKLAVTAKERESVRRKLVVTARKLAVTAKGRESVRRRLVVTAENLSQKAKQLAVTAKERESIRRSLAVTAKDLEQIQAKNEAMLESIGDGLVATDKNQHILLVNKAFERILGWKEGEVQGKLMSKIITMVDESGREIPASERLITKTIREGTIVTEEEKEHAVPETKTTSGNYYYVRKDKTKFPVAVTVAPVRLNKKIIGTIEVFRDITREKEIDKAKSEFITLASHQLKTPPTAIKLLTERLLGGKMGTFTDKQKEYVSDIHSSNQRMIDLINALLNVSRIELGAFTIKVNEKDVGGIVQTTLDELKPVIEKKQLKLTASYPEKAVQLMLDEPLFRMVITNLVTNAMRYTAEGGEIKVEGKTVNAGETLGEKLIDENSFVLEVSDTGFGIPLKDQAKVFTKFFRADNAREKITDGTGLGLYIVKSVLDHSGGRIWFTSQENVGTQFYVAIPMTGMRAKAGEKGLVGK